MTVNPSPNINPITPIPNNPFYYPETWSIDGPQGQFITGTGILINPATGTISAAAGPNPPGTVTLVSPGTGIVTSPVGGINSAGSVSLAPVGGVLVPGNYNMASITVDIYGRIVAASSSSANVVQGISAQYPIEITGSNSFPTIGIDLATTTNAGAVQLRDDCITPSNTLALTANQGFLLQNQVNTLSSLLNDLYLGGSLNPTSGTVVSATVAGNLAGITAANPLPAPAPANLGAEMLVTQAGSYSPPGGGGPYDTVAGDKFISDGATWQFFPTGFRATAATTSAAGIVELADVAETEALADFTLAVTPGTLGALVATETQRGLTRLATIAETQALSANNVTITPATLNTVNASTSQKGLVQLINVTGSGSTTLAPTAALLDAVASSGIPKEIINGVGDIIVGAAPDTPAILPRGTNGSVLTVDVTKPLGLDWNIPNAPTSVPVGCIMWYTSVNPDNLPVGWVVCDGSSYSNATEISPGVPNPYFDLYDIIGNTFGGNLTTFKVPDLQGMFVRGFDPSGTVDDPARVFGSVQQDALEAHSHTTAPHTHTNAPHQHNLLPISTATVIGDDNGLYRGNGNFGGRVPTMASGPVTQTNSVAIDTATVTVNSSPAPTPDETRPVNIALLPIIKYTDMF
jgi:energy-coupling factor transporter ATP-binding protein EcfA2